MPQSDSNRIRYLSADPGALGHEMDAVSFIPFQGDCMSPEDNPENRSKTASGHIQSVSNDKLFLGLHRVALMSPGLYAVCFQNGTQKSFISTGVTIQIQNEVSALVVNLVTSVMATIPKTMGSTISYCLDTECQSTGRPGDRLALIGGELSCQDLEHNPAVATIDKSGHLTPDGNTRMLAGSIIEQLFHEESGLLSATIGEGSNFQLCFSKGGPFLTTGITLRVQTQILGLITNGVMPNNGLRTALPNAVGGEVAYYRGSQGVKGEALSLIWDESHRRRCDLLDETNNPETGNQNASGHWNAMGSDFFVSGTDSLDGMRSGLYQVCFRSYDRVWRATGLSVKVQSAVTSIDLGDGKGQSAILYKRKGNALVLTGDNQLDGAESASLVGGRGDCNDLTKWNTRYATKQSSGREGGLFIMSPGFNTAVPMREDVLVSPKTLMPFTYQFCLKPGPDIGWIETGITVTVKWSCNSDAVSTSFDLVYAHETTSWASLSNVVSIIVKSTLPRLPEGGVMVVRGLKGSLTPDNDAMEVHGNVVHEEDYYLSCLGRHHCSVVFRDYLQNGRMLILAALSIDVKCTDLDSAGETVTAIEVNGRSILGSATAGPWDKCANNCSRSRNVLVNYPLTAESGFKGDTIHISMSLSDNAQMYACGDENLLNAKVRLHVVTSELSIHSLVGTWDQLNGDLNLLDIPYVTGKWMHLSFLLRNPEHNSEARFPTVEMCALTSTAPRIPGTKAQILHSGGANQGLLSSETLAAFTSFTVNQSSLTEQVLNRLSFNLETNFPRSLPKNLAITISGLKNALDPPSNDFSLLTDDSDIVDSLECAGGLYCSQAIALGCPFSECGRLHTITLDVDIFCTDFDAADSSKFIEYIRVCKKPEARQCNEEYCQSIEDMHCDQGSSLKIPPEAYSRGPWQDCSGCSSSTRKVLEAYDMTRFLAAFGLDLIVEIGASKSVSKLYCYDSYPKVQSVRAILKFKRTYAMQSSVWTGVNGQVIFNPNPAIATCGFQDTTTNAPCLPRLKFDVELQNPIGIQAGDILEVSAAGAGLVFQPRTFGPVMSTVKATEISVEKASLREVTRTRGNAPGTRGLNRLNLEVTFSRPVDAGMTITLAGLTGSLSDSAICDPVLLPRCPSTPPNSHCIYSDANPQCQRGLALIDYRLGSALSGSWNQTSGTLTFMVQASFQNMRTLFLSFSLFNPIEEQSTPVLHVSGSGVGLTLPPHRVESSAFRGGGRYEDPTSEAPRILSASVKESNKVAGQINYVDISLIANTFLKEGSIITVSGLNGLEMRADAAGNPQSGGWIGDSLEHVQTIIVAGDDVSPSAQWQAVASKEDQMSWYCSAEGHGWIESTDDFWKLGEIHGFQVRNKISTQSWCQPQPAQSILLRLRRCIEAGSSISIKMALPNGLVPQAEARLAPLPTVAVAGGSVTLPTAPLLPAHFQKEHTVQCRGRGACTASMEQNPDCFDPECRFLSPSAVLMKAYLSIDVICTDFSTIGKFIERVGICIPPKCVPPFSWNQVENKCCTVEGVCQPYLCVSSMARQSYETGPWDGCSRNCSASRRILNRFNIMPMICGTQSRCTVPDTFVVVVATSTFVQDRFCGPDTLDAQLSLQYEYTYDRSLVAGETGRISFFMMQEGTDTSKSLNTLSTSIEFSSRVPKGSKLIISNILGSSTRSTASLPVENMRCHQLRLSDTVACVLSASRVLSTTASWDQQKGTIDLVFLQTVEANTKVSFRFVLQNSASKQEAIFPLATINIGNQQLRARRSSASLLSSSKPPRIEGGGFVLESLDVQGALNDIKVIFSCNFYLQKNSLLEVSGLTGSNTLDTDSLTINFSTPSRSETSKASWTKSTGSLTFRISRDVESYMTIELDFQLLNPSTSQIAPTVRVSVPSPSLPGAASSIDARISSVLFGNILSGATARALERAVIAEGNSIADQENNLKLTFRPNAILPFGSRVLLTGLKGAQNPSSMFYPVLIQSTACSAAEINLLGQWIAESGTLQFLLPCHVHFRTQVSVHFTLQNPNTTQRAKGLFVSASHEQSHFRWAPVVGAVLGPKDIPRFLVAAIAASSQTASMESVLTVAIKANILIDKGFVLEVRELSSSPSSSIGPSGAMVLVSASFQGGTANGIEWESKWDRGTLEVVIGAAVQANRILRLRFQLMNPAQPLPGIHPVITLKSPSGPKQRKLLRPRLLSGTALSSIVNGSIMSATLHEETSVQGSENMITLRFTLDFNLGAGAQLTLTGITGSMTSCNTDDCDIDITGPDSHLFHSASWQRATGTLTLSVAPQTFHFKPAARPIEINWILINPGAPQPRGIMPILKSAGLIKQELTINTSIFRATVQSRWTQHHVSEDCPARSCLNTISMTLACDVSLPQRTKITISSITGAKISDPTNGANIVSSSVNILGSGAQYVEAAEWTQETQPATSTEPIVFMPATLVLTLAKTVLHHTNITFSFRVTNLDIISGESIMFVSARGNYTEFNTSLEVAKARLEGQVLRGTIDPKFVTSIIHETSTAPTEKNVITVSLSATDFMPKETSISISGLTGSMTVDGSIAIVPAGTFQNAESSSGVNVYPDGTWHAHQGVLLVRLKADIPSFQILSFSWTIKNPRKAQDQVSPQVWTDKLPRVTLVRDHLQWHMGFRRWRGWLDPVLSPGVARSVLGAGSAVMFSSLHVTEKSKVPAVTNQLEFSMTLSATVPAGAVVSITQLLGSSSEDSNAMLVMVQHGSSKYPSTLKGNFTRVLGILDVMIPHAIQQGILLVISVNLHNPQYAQIPVQPKVSLRLDAASIHLPATQASASSTCCLSADGNYYVESATIREESDIANEQNVLHLTVATSFPLVTGTQVSLTGLAGSQTPSNPSLILNGDDSLRASWAREGNLTFPVSEKVYDCKVCSTTPSSSCDSKRKISVSFSLRNSVASQSALRVQVTVLSAGGTPFFEPTEVAGGRDVLRARGLGKIFGRISDSGADGHLPVPGAVNLITVTMRANKALDACRTSLYKPGSSVQATWITNAASLAPCPWRNGAKCFAHVNLFDGLTGSGVQIPAKDSARPGTGYIQLDLGTVVRIDAFRVTGTRGTINIAHEAQARRVRLLWSHNSMSGDSQWQVAGEIDLPFIAGPLESKRFRAVSSQFWRFEVVSNWESPSFKLYPFSNVQELELYACPDAQTTRITITNLTGSLTADNAYLTLSNIATQSPSSLHPTGVWSQLEGKLIVKMDYVAKAFDEMSFSFNLTYPPGTSPQQPRTVHISAQGSVNGNSLDIPSTQMFGTVLGADPQAQQTPGQEEASSVGQTEANAILFSTAIISSFSKVARADTVITLTLAPALDLPRGANITITGLEGTPSLQSVVSSSAAMDFASLQPPTFVTRKWHNDGLCLACIIFSVTAESWPKGQPIEAMFSAANPQTVQQRSSELRVTVSSSTVHGTQSLCGAMGPAGTCQSFPNVFDIEYVPGLLVAVGTDSTRTQSEQNTITIGLIPNIQVLKGTKFTFSGLLKSSTFSTDKLKLEGPWSHLFGFYGTFNQFQGRLVITAQENLLNTREAPAIEISFTLTNGPSAQEKQNISASMTLPTDSTVGTCGRMICDILPQIGSKPDSAFSIGLYSDITTNRVLDQALSLLNHTSTRGIPPAHTTALTISAFTPVNFMRSLDPRQFLTKKISESSDISNQDTLITVELSTNFIVRDGAQVTLTGLTASQTEDSSTLPVMISGEGEKIASWQKAAGILTLSLKQTLLPYLGRVTVSFVLRNPATPPSAPSVAMVGMVGVLPQALDGSVLGAGGAPEVTKFEIQESGTVVGQENVLTIRLVSNVPLFQGLTLSLSRLVGRADACVGESSVTSASIKTLPAMKIWFTKAAQPAITSLNEANLIGNGTNNACMNNDGRLTVQTTYSVAAGEEMVFEFQVRNWPHRLPGAAPIIAADGCIAPLLVSGAVATTCDMTKTMTLPAKSSSTPVLASGHQPQISDVCVSENTPVIAQSNVIYLSITLNFRLQNSSKLVLRGMAGGGQKSETADDSDLVLNGTHARVFGSSGDWNQTAGTLALQTVSSVPPREEIKIEFRLQNAGTQSKARCVGGEPFCSAGGAWEGQPCPVVGADCAGVCTGGTNFCSDSGVCAAFELPAQQAEANIKCPGGICIRANSGRQCPARALLSSLGQAGPAADAAHPYGYTLAPEQYEGLLADLDGEKVPMGGVTCNGGGTCAGIGKCQAPNTGQICESHLECTGVFYPSKAVAGDPFAHLGPARCQRVRTPASMTLSLVQADVGHVLTTNARGLVYGLTNPEPPQFHVRQISESSAVSSANNVLSVFLQSNFELQALQETVITLTGLVSSTPSRPRLPLLSAERRLSSHVDCVNSVRPDGQQMVRCDEVGSRALVAGDLVIEARLSLEAQCPSTLMSSGQYCSNTSTLPCALLTDVRVGGVPVDGFSSAPCLQRFNCSHDSWCGVLKLLPVAHLLDPAVPENSAGFLVEVNVSLAVAVRAKVDIFYTREYASWNQSTGELVVTGISAPSFISGDRSLNFSFQLQNPGVSREAPEITVVGQSGVVKSIGICDDTLELGCQQKGDPSSVRARVQGQVLSGRIRPAFMAAATISQETDVAGVPNTITVSITPASTDFTAGSSVTIAGLVGLPLASTNSLAVVSDRVAPTGEWDMTRGQLTMLVISQPAYRNAPLVLSFTLRNPVQRQPPLLPSVRVVGGMRDAFVWGAPALTCATAVGCAGVLGGATELRLTTSRVWEANRQVTATNHISFSLRANVPLLSQESRLVLTGLPLPAKADRVVPLLTGSSFIRRSATCTGRGKCIMLSDTRVPAGTISTSVELRLRVDCAQTHTVYAITACGESLLPATLRCSSPTGSGHTTSSDSFVTLVDGAVIATCLRPEASLLEVAGSGMMLVQAEYTLRYAYDTTAVSAEWSDSVSDSDSTGGLLSLRLRPNTSSIASASVLDAFAYAFKIAVQNGPSMSAARFPSARLEYEVAVSGPQVVSSEQGVLASGLARLPQVSFWQAKAPATEWDVGEVVIPAPGMGAYPDGADSELVLVVNTVAGMRTRIVFLDLDLDLATDRLYLIDGDSVISPRVCGVFNADSWGDVSGTFQGFFPMDSFFFTSASSFTIHIVRSLPAPATGSRVEPAEANSGRRGARIRAEVSDINKVDQVVVSINIDGAARLEASDTAKVAQQMALLLNIVSSRISVDSSAASRRVPTRRRGTKQHRTDVEPDSLQQNADVRAAQEVVLRILAGSPADADKLASVATSQLNGGGLTVALQTSGQVGIASLKSIRIFRCGQELKCVDLPPPPPPPPAVVVNATPPPPYQFPVELVVTNAAAIAVPVVAASGAILLLMCVAWFRRRRHSKIMSKESTYKYLKWLDAKKDHIMYEMSGGQCQELCDRYGLEYLDFDYSSFIDDLCLQLFYEYEYPVKLAEDKDEEIAEANKALADAEQRMQQLQAKQDGLDPFAIGKKAKQEADRVDMALTDVRSEIKTLRADLAVKQKEQAARKASISKNPNTSFWRYLPKGACL